MLLFFKHIKRHPASFPLLNNSNKHCRPKLARINVISYHKDILFQDQKNEKKISSLVYLPSSILQP